MCFIHYTWGKIYPLYLELLNCENLEVRRKKICEKFAKKSVKHPKFNHWFKKKDDTVQNVKQRKAKIQKKNKYHPVQYRTERYRDSPLPYLTELLNNM